MDTIETQELDFGSSRHGEEQLFLASVVGETEPKVQFQSELPIICDSGFATRLNP